MIPTDGNLVRLLVRRVTEAPQHPLYNFLDRHGAVEASLSRESLYYSACRLAALLQDRGLQSRPVALYYPHGQEFVIAFWAVILAGAIPVPLVRVHSSNRSGSAAEKDPEHSSGIPLAALQQSGAEAVLTVTARAGAVSRDSGLPVVATDRSSAGGGRWEQPDPDTSRTAFIQYTSGSTSSPRGVLISHGNILHNSEAIRRAFGVRADDTGVCWLPLHHDMGLIGHVIQPLYSGITNHFLSPAVFAARPIRWLQALEQYGGTISGGPDSAFALCNSRIDPGEIAMLDLSRWRLAYCGAERIRRTTLDQFAGRFRAAGFDRHSLYPCYGLAEATLFVSGRHGLKTTTVPDSGSVVHAASVGACMPGGRVTVTDPVTGVALPDGRIGEISLSSPSVAGGYHRDPLSTFERFSPAEEGASALHTGDLGFLQEGELYVTGRADHCIQRHGRNVFAEDVEAAVMAAQPHGVARCAAFALEAEGPESGARVAIVLEHDGQAGWSEAEACLDTVPGIVSMATGLVPDDVQLWPRGGIPLTTSGKTRRNHCRDLYIRSAGTPQPAFTGTDSSG